MKTRDELIEDFLQTPLTIGEKISYKNDNYTIVEILDECCVAKNLSYSYKGNETILKKDILRNVRNIGYNPFIDVNRYSRVIAFDIDTIINRFDKEPKPYFKEYLLNGINELNWNPFVTLLNGEKFYYQRDFVWTLENKQNLIQSLCKGLELGRIVVYKREFEDVEKELKAGNLDVCFYDIVDGKQRLKTLIDFVNNKFFDKNGYYWKDYSIHAQYKILSQQTLIYVELDTECSSRDILQTFVNNAVEGVKLDTNHLKLIEQKLSEC